MKLSCCSRPDKTAIISSILCESEVIALLYIILLSLPSKTPNFLPTLSKFTGDHLPEQYTWRLVISFTMFPKIIEAILYYNFFATQRPLFHFKRWYRWLNKLNWLLRNIELLFLLSWNLISSREDMCKYTVLKVQKSIILNKKMHAIAI